MAGIRAAPLQYDLRGSDLDELDEVAEQMIARDRRKFPGIVDVNSTYDAGKPEVERPHRPRKGLGPWHFGPGSGQRRFTP